jgi:Zinc carboxypeptidase
MDFIHDHHFVMSANFHGGAEVMNYPWDTWYPGSPDFKPHADNSWFEFICHEYADTAQKYGPSGYLTDLDDGVTNGAEWYTIAGGRQDYVTYFRQGREVTMEISNTKRPSAIDLPQYWDANYRSLLNYMEQALYGIRGTVKDADTGMPVKAYLHIPGHDRENSEVYSDSLYGFFTRLLDQGTYSIEFTASGYFPLTVDDIMPRFSRWRWNRMEQAQNTIILTGFAFILIR